MSGVRIRLLALDVDGVITDGTVALLASGEEVRSIHFHDLDAVARAQRLGLSVAILSGEDSPAGRRLAERFGISEAVWGAKDKRAGLAVLTERLGIPVTETCYVGDSDRDAPALSAAAVGLAPADATTRARSAADAVLSVGGGRGVVGAALEWLERTCDLPGGEELR
ncbi:MAG: HAD family hydrolase [Actinomycetes bacterium]